MRAIKTCDVIHSHFPLVFKWFRQNIKSECLLVIRPPSCSDDIMHGLSGWGRRAVLPQQIARPWGDISFSKVNLPMIPVNHCHGDVRLNCFQTWEQNKCPTTVKLLISSVTSQSMVHLKGKLNRRWHRCLPLWLSWVNIVWKSYQKKMRWCDWIEAQW